MAVAVGAGIGVAVGGSGVGVRVAAEVQAIASSAVTISKPVVVLFPLGAKRFMSRLLNGRYFLFSWPPPAALLMQPASKRSHPVKDR